MARLFKNKIIEDKINKFEIPDFESKLEIVKNWYRAFETGELQSKNETQCEQAFNQDFFVKVLDYIPFPNEIYSIQPKDNVDSGGGQIPDATLGYFKNGLKRVVAVVEIKDVNTPLDKAQRRDGNMSPIQQAFKYKPQFKECGFVIATNFNEIRLFRDNQLDYERFTLTELIKPENDYYNFRKFYFLLCSSNFITEKGQTETEKLLSAIRVEQEKITNKFYREYKQLREDLIRDIIENNAEIKRSDFFVYVVEKAQKIVDRLVFICFFEDSGLLPENKLNEVVDYAQKGSLDEPIWDTLKKFFRAVDEGSEKLGVPNGYNGELFKSDEDLNKLKISDDVCKRFVELTKYDFSEDLSVNILGHIFEQSISDLERLKQYSEGDQEENKNQTKRKKDGIFYTPEYIVDYIVKNSLGRLLEEKEQEILERHKLDDKRVKETGYNKKIILAYTEYSNFLRNVKVLDPACGSGAFLVKVFDYLLAEHKRVFRITNEAEGKGIANALFSDDELIKPILENNIFGVDLNPESVEITKLSLWLKSAKRGQKLITLKNNIKCGNSLIDNSTITNGRTFDWMKEFPEIISNGGFDIVVGNPPYVNAITLSKTNSDEVRRYWKDRFFTARGTYDLYILFFELGMQILKKNGYLAYITPNKYISADFGEALRGEIVKKYELIELYDYSSTNVFQDPSVYPVITILRKANPINYQITVKKIFEDVENPVISFFSNDSLKEFQDNKFSLLLSDKFTNISKWLSGCVLLSELAEVNATTTASEWDIISEFIEENGSGKKVINTGTIDRYTHTWGHGKLKNKGKEYLNPTFIVDKANLSSHRLKIINSEKIILAKLALQIEACYDKSGDIAAVSTNCIYAPKTEVPLYYLLAVLNSKLLSFIYKQLFGGLKMGGGYLQYQSPQIRKIPIKIDNDLSYLATRAERLVDIYSKFNNQYFSKLTLLKSELNLTKISKKLSRFYKMEFDSFIKETKISWSIEKKEQLLTFFDKARNELMAIEREINILENEIDDRVNKIYGLSEQDIKSLQL